MARQRKARRRGAFSFALHQNTDAQRRKGEADEHQKGYRLQRIVSGDRHRACSLPAADGPVLGAGKVDCRATGERRGCCRGGLFALEETGRKGLLREKRAQDAGILSRLRIQTGVNERGNENRLDAEHRYSRDRAHFGRTRMVHPRRQALRLV